MSGFKLAGLLRLRARHEEAARRDLGGAQRAVLEAKARLAADEPRQALLNKIAILHRMIAFSRTVPDRWVEHDKLGKLIREAGIRAE